MSPLKAEDVAKDTFWRGGVDCGNWFGIDSVLEENKTAIIKIYKSTTGALIDHRLFKFYCNSVILWDRLEEQIEMYDGQKILRRVLSPRKK